MEKSKILTIAIAVLAVIVLGVVLRNNNSNNTSDVVKMGVILPMTGNSAIIGEPKKRAFDIALEQYNANGKKLEIIYEDSHGTTKDGVAAFNKLLADNTIDCYYIDMTPIVNACVPQMNSHKVISFAGSAQPEITNLSNYLFRLFAGGDQEIEMMVEMLEKLSIKNIFILHTNELYGINSLRLLKTMFENRGGKVIGSDEYPMNNGDFKSQLIKAKESNAEKIILLGYGNEYPTLLKQAHELGISPHSLAANLGGSNKSVIELPSELTEGMYIIGPRFSYLLGENNLYPEMKKFVDLYESKYK